MSEILTPTSTQALPGESAEACLNRIRPLLREATRLGIPRHLPRYLRLSLAAYLCHHRPPDFFLKRVLENDLFGALDEATPLEASILLDLARWICQHAPLNAAGTKEDVRAWLGLDED